MTARVKQYRKDGKLLVALTFSGDNANARTLLKVMTPQAYQELLDKETIAQAKASELDALRVNR